MLHRYVAALVEERVLPLLPQRKRLRIGRRARQRWRRGHGLRWRPRVGRQVLAFAFALRDVMRNDERGMPWVDRRIVPRSTGHDEAQHEASANESHGPRYTTERARRDSDARALTDRNLERDREGRCVPFEGRPNAPQFTRNWGLEAPKLGQRQFHPSSVQRDAIE